MAIQFLNVRLRAVNPPIQSSPTAFLSACPSPCASRCSKGCSPRYHLAYACEATRQ